MESKNLIGKELFFDESGYQDAQRLINKELIPLIDAVIEAYNDLESVPKFSQSVFNRLIKDKGKSIFDAYQKQAEDDIKTLKNKTLRLTLMQGVDKALEPLKEAINEMLAADDDLSTSPTFGSSIDVHLNDVIIKNGKPEPKLERIKKVCTDVIETEAQAEAFTLCRRMQKDIDRLYSIIDSNSNIQYKEVNGTILAIAPKVPLMAGFFEFDSESLKPKFNERAVSVIE